MLDSQVKSMKLFEWVTSAMMIGIAIIVAVSPNAIHSGGFSLMANIGLTGSVIGILFMAAGAIRMVALYANGNWPVIGPRLRAGCAAGGAFVWAQMLIALVKWSEQSGYISIGVSVYTFLVVGEIISCHRAASDGIVKHVGPVD
jgi:hypothetical protein